MKLTIKILFSLCLILAMGTKNANANFIESKISKELNEVKKVSKEKSADDSIKDIEAIAAVFSLLSGTGHFEREIKGQLVDEGKSIRDGKRKVTFSNVKFKDGKISVQEDVYSIRTEYENVNGERGNMKILNRVVNRSTRIEFSLASEGGVEFRNYRLGSESEIATSKGYALFHEGAVQMAGQSRISDYPTTETTSIKGLSQSLKRISAKEGTLITDAITLRVPENEGEPYIEFGEWDQVTSYFAKNTQDR